MRLEADDAIQGTSNSLNAVIGHGELGVLPDHKVDGSIT